ncbi:MAG: VTT domain-containing protein [Proteobacteria bacterium]|nr:VTT domain-containing protein [Pseudomonadota bacterium]
MTADTLSASLAHYGPWLVFGNVLLQQLGAPVPAWPTLLLVGSLAAGWPQVAGALAAALAAAMLADRLWYLLGRRYGYKVLALLCRLSINPGSCVMQTEQRFARWGAPALLLAKFVPGFSAVAAPVAGLARMPVARFTLAAAGGATLWAGTALLLGWLLREQVGRLLALMRTHGPLALLGLAVALALWLGVKFWRRQRFARWAAMPHIEAYALQAALASAAPPRLLDLRGTVLAASDPIAQAQAVELRQLARQARGWPRDTAIVTLCACPQDATAIRAARRLQRLGFTNVRPLRGGYEAWSAARAAQAGNAGMPATPACPV